MGKCVLLLLALLISICAYGQADKATLRGTVTDAAGVPLARVSVEIIESETQVFARRAITGSSGQFEAPYLKPGLYQLKVDQTGFDLFEAEDVEVEAGRVREFNLTLQRGNSSSAQPVQDNPPLIPVAGGTVSARVERDEAADAPVTTLLPSVLPLAVTAAGVQGADNSISITGQLRKGQTYTVDGVPQDTIGQPQGIPQFLETVAVTSANPAASEYRAAGVEMTSRRGTESFHGEASYRWGDAILNASPYFGAQKMPYSLSEAGAEAGGRVIAGRTYIFGGWVHQQNAFTQTLYADVPTDLMRSRDFSQYLNAGTSPSGTVVIVRDPRTGAPFPNNVIPSNRVTAVSNNFLTSYIPAANAAVTNSFPQNYSWSHAFSNGPFRADWPFVRLDQKLWDGNQAYVRFLETRSSAVAAGSVGEQLNSTRSLVYNSWAISDTQALGPTAANNLTFGYMHLRVRQGEEEANVSPVNGSSVISTTGLQGTNAPGFETAGFPTMAINGITGLSMAYAGGSDNGTAQSDNATTFQDSVVWLRGRHSLQFGGQYLHDRWLQGAIPQTVYGSFTFTGQYSGVGFADFLLGIPATSSRQNPLVNRTLHQDQGGLFVADSFRVTPKLTIDLGLRWDTYGTPVYDDGYMYNWNPANGHVIVAPGTLTSVSPLYPKTVTVETGNVTPRTKLTNLRPRAAAAYRMGEHMVVRGAYGEFTESRGYGSEGLLNDSGPFGLLETYFNSVTNGTVALTFPKPFPSSPASSMLPVPSVTALPSSGQEGVIRQFNATLEREWRGLAIRGSYIGSRGSGMNYTVDVNKPQASTVAYTAARRPYPQFGSTTVTRNDGEWHYDALQAAARKRAGAVVFDAGFTWANNTSNYANTYDPYHVTDKWTRDAATRRQYASGSATWMLPFGKGRKFLSQGGGIAGRVISDWNLQAIATLASGQYYSALFTGPDPANASATYVTQLADCIGDANSGARSVPQWFNPAAFSVPLPSSGRYGNCAMNSLEGFPIHIAHLSLNRSVALKEQVRLVFTARVSNATNTAHFTIPNNNISTTNAGMFTAASQAGSETAEQLGPRRIDLRLQLRW